LAGRVRVVAAIDINTKALDVFRRNFPDAAAVARARTIESIPWEEMAAWAGDLWWMSPPCQPHTVRGLQQGLQDPRSASFLHLMAAIKAVKPPRLLLENVAGFWDSDSRALWRETLLEAGYDLHEEILCPTMFGVPARRPRYFGAATRLGKVFGHAKVVEPRRLVELIDPTADDPVWEVPEAILKKYAGAIHVVSRDETDATTRCFTSAYGRSPVRSGSYLRWDGGVRYFTPREILSLLGFHAGFQWPEGMTPREMWALAGNSLDLGCVRHVAALIGV
jgi:site-specific DNA-cytosine methylase